MKQILQSLKNGKTSVEEIPIPQLKDGEILIESTFTLISPGTERMLLQFGKAGIIDKAKQQPDKVKLVLNKFKTDGIKPTLEQVFKKLEEPIPLGYCNVGKIIAIGKGVRGFKIGDRVISNGSHAEIVSVPVNLCAKVPDNVDDQDAAFTVLGAISLQSIRLTNPTLGETIAVIGMGLVGLLTGQLLKANGCKVIGLDFDAKKLKLARKFGIETINLGENIDVVKTSNFLTNGKGVDGVIISAATKSNDPIHKAALMCRQRGRIILVGVAGMQLSRDDFFKKELTFQVSSSYGPGRYDKSYEEKGLDYPIGFVRWTEQRNFEAVLNLINEGKLNLKELVSHKFNLDEAEKAYEIISNGKESLAILISYRGLDNKTPLRTIDFQNNIAISNKESSTVVSFIGAGNYSSSILIPAFKKAGATLYSIASNKGITGRFSGKRFGFKNTTTNVNSIFEDNLVNSVIITTRHNTHAKYVLETLKAGKNVFVEKPLCLNKEELLKIKNILESETIVSPSKNIFKPILMIGFNRRFAPQIKKIKSLISNIKEPKSIIITVNAGFVDSENWTQDKEVGGGRIIGEACHFIDLLRFLIGHPIYSWSKVSMNSAENDTFSINLEFNDGSIGTIHYFANGSKSFPKERIEVFTHGRILQLDNYRKLRGYGWPNFNKFNLIQQNKGQNECVASFLKSVKDSINSPIPKEEIFEVMEASIEIAKD